jgi:hypothetical protein
MLATCDAAWQIPPFAPSARRWLLLRATKLDFERIFKEPRAGVFEMIRFSAHCPAPVFDIAVRDQQISRKPYKPFANDATGTSGRVMRSTGW